MLNSVQSLQTRKVGVVDTNTNNIIVPLSYKAIFFQKYGITALNENGTYDAYLFNGNLVINNVYNPLFLDDNIILVSSQNNACYIYDYKKQKPVYSSNLNSVLFFMGSNTKAIQYTPHSNFSTFFNSPDYINHGAHLEDLVCARFRNRWGVINRKTNSIHAEFKYKVIVQCVNNQIAVRGDDGSTLLL